MSLLLLFRPQNSRHGVVTWAELEVPDVAVADRAAIITWAELEVPPLNVGGRLRYIRELEEAAAREAADRERRERPAAPPEKRRESAPRDLAREELEAATGIPAEVLLAAWYWLQE